MTINHYTKNHNIDDLVELLDMKNENDDVMKFFFISVEVKLELVQNRDAVIRYDTYLLKFMILKQFHY
jgi:hypothetical protein